MMISRTNPIIYDPTRYEKIFASFIIQAPQDVGVCDFLHYAVFSLVPSKNKARQQQFSLHSKKCRGTTLDE